MIKWDSGVKTLITGKTQAIQQMTDGDRNNETTVLAILASSRQDNDGNSNSESKQLDIDLLLSH